MVMNIRFNTVYVAGLHNSVMYNLKRMNYLEESRLRGDLHTKIQTVLQEIERR